MYKMENECTFAPEINSNTNEILAGSHLEGCSFLRRQKAFLQKLKEKKVSYSFYKHGFPVATTCPPHQLQYLTPRSILKGSSSNQICKINHEFVTLIEIDTQEH